MIKNIFKSVFVLAFLRSIYYIKSMAKRILIVDDDLFIRELYEEILKSEGYVVETASGGKQGLEMITQNQYDLILLDIMLPQIDGIGIITKLKESQSKVPLSSIIFLTNLSRDPVVKEALAVGVRSCLIKSDITPEQLLEQVKIALGKSSVKQSNNSSEQL